MNRPTSYPALSSLLRTSFTFAVALVACVATLNFHQTAKAGGVEAVNAAGLFEAMEAGDVQANFIPQNAAKANLLIKNLTKKPMQVRLPAAFAGVPVLAQGMMGGMGGGMGGMGGGMGGGGMGGGGGGGQAMGGGGGMGGGMGGGGMGGGGMGGGGGMFTIKPGRVQKVALNTVCLEHGKPDPNPKMKYAIVPLEKVTQDPKVRVLCTALGNGEIAQNTAQAAAWNLMDNISWPELAAKNRVESRYTGNIRFFSPFEIHQARTVVQQISQMVPSESESNSGNYSESPLSEAEASGSQPSRADLSGVSLQ